MLKLDQIIEIHGKPKYYISCDTKIDCKDIIYSKFVDKGSGELFCENTNVEGIYHYGYKQLIDTYDHVAGYIWSSRAGSINGEFGTQLFDDCIINGVGYLKIDINTLKSLVEEYTKDKYNIEQYYASYDHKKEEPLYRLVKQ